MAGSFVDAHGNTAAAATVDVTAPDGIADGDILIASAHARKTTGVPTTGLPAGFTPIAASAFGNLNHHYAIGWKRASSESGNYTFTGSAATTIEACISVFRGLLASGDVVDVYSDIAYATANQIIRAATVTVTATGILVGSFYVNTTAASSVEPEAGFTESIEVGQAAAAYHYLEHSYKLGVAVGATGNVDADAAGTDAPTTKHGFLLALKDAVFVPTLTASQVGSDIVVGWS